MKKEPHELIIEAIEEGRNACVTGGAGTGKSYNIRKVIEYCDDNNIQVARTAMTGMASLQLPEGETVHSCFKTGLHHSKLHLINVVTSYIFQKETSYLLRILDLIIIDEMSMMRADFLELLDAILKYVMQNELPFGGKQVIFSGDFMQLPPIVKDDEDIHIKNNYWAFESPVWAELELKIIYLTEIKRQDDINFSNALNMIRAGAVNQSVNDYFFKTHSHKFPLGTEPVKLLSTNVEVETNNMARLKVLATEQEKYVAEITADNEFYRKKIINDVVAMENLYLKVGCQVMILKNCKGSYVNGSMGEYLGKHKIKTEDEGIEVEALQIRLFDNNSIVYLEPAQWTIEKTIDGIKHVYASFTQFPVKLGYAITIHKSQGMSIDYLEVNLGKCFADGMAYVALSRARKYEGLRVTNWNSRAVKCNKKAFDFYMGLKSSGVI